jgi:hypothetical protein
MCWADFFHPCRTHEKLVAEQDGVEVTEKLGPPDPYIRMPARVLPSHAKTVEFLFATGQNKTMMLKKNSTHAVLKVNDILPDRNSFG